MTNVTIRLSSMFELPHIIFQSGLVKIYIPTPAFVIRHSKFVILIMPRLNQLLNNKRLVSEIHLVADPRANQPEAQGRSGSDHQV